MMYGAFAEAFSKEREEQINASNPEVYLEKALIHIQKKRDIIEKAGEMISIYLELDK